MPTLHIRTTPPGPRARMLLRRYERYVAPSATQSYPLVVDHAAGCHVWDVDGNCYLDFTAGIAVSAVGHGHKQVVGAITAQVDRLIHFSFAAFFYPSYIRLAERLAELAPGREPKQVYLCNSGAEAIEGAIKLVRHSTRRPYILAFYNAFHGRTLGALSLTASKPVQRRGLRRCCLASFMRRTPTRTEAAATIPRRSVWTISRTFYSTPCCHRRRQPPSSSSRFRAKAGWSCRRTIS